LSRAVFSNSEEGARPARLDRDRGLVEAARRDPSRFDALYRKYLAQVYSYAFYELRDHHAAEDATERTFMQALVGLPRFEERVDAFIASRPALSTDDAADISTFRVWLFRIARNVIANERRRDRRRPVSSLD
jgi:DNA-directed RNA polymerase specialized sigma24 family protein